MIISEASPELMLTGCGPGTQGKVITTPTSASVVDRLAVRGTQPHKEKANKEAEKGKPKPKP